MKVILASQNQHKLVELSAILSQLGFEIALESEYGLHVDVDETGTTFEENSLLKAEAVMKASGLPVLADDSGLGWSREMENVMETSLNTALIQVLPDGNILLNGGPVSTSATHGEFGLRHPLPLAGWPEDRRTRRVPRTDPACTAGTGGLWI